MNKFLVLLMMVLLSLPALAQHRGGGHGRGHGGGWGHGNGQHFPNPGHGNGRHFPNPGHGRYYPHPGNGGYHGGGSCVVQLVNRLGFVIETYYGYNDYYNRGCSSALRQCQLEMNHRGLFKNRCIVRY